MITSPYVLGDFMSHQSNITDKLIYNNLKEYTYFIKFTLYFSIFQIITFTGFNLFTFIPLLSLIGLSIFLLLNLKEENIDSDNDYSSTNDIIGIGFTVSILCIIVSLIDIFLVLFISRHQISFLWNLNNKFENRFALFSCFIVFSRLFISFIHMIWMKNLSEKTNTFSMVNKTSS